jgi:hypothetical protein
MSELIESLLTETELGDDDALRELLCEMEREATSVRPMPSAALAELLRSPDAHQPVRRPAIRGRGAVITGAVVIGLLGLGAGAAAASPDVRSVIGAGAANIAHLFEPATAEPRAPRDGATHSPKSPSSPDSSETVAPEPSDRASDRSASGHGGGSQSANESGPGSAASGHSDDSNSGATDGHDDGNQSGNGNGKGQGNGGPAPAP